MNTNLLPAKGTGLPVVMLIRVSTNKQETTRQQTELQAAADAKGWEVIEVCEETVSGNAQMADRAGLMRVQELVEAGMVEKVMVHEVSRLARRSSIVHTFVEMLESHGVSLYWHAQGIETMLSNGKRNPAAAIMLALLAEMARAERDTLRERINSGLAEARRKGVKLGRPEGSKISTEDFLRGNADIVKQLKNGQSVRNTAKITGKGTTTVMKVKTVLKAAA